MIAPEGWPFVVGPLCLGGVLLLLDLPYLGWPLIVAGAFGLYFFRNPTRRCTADPEIASSPADGRIITVGASPASIAELGLPQQVSIFMSVFDVHVNRAPIAGRLVDYSYSPGRKFSAFKEKASLANEQNLSLWEGSNGRIALKQIAGLIARRIVFDHAPGAEVERGDRIGLIRYGSRVDVFLPADAEVLVTRGEKARAGQTPLCRLRKAQ
jgi:phosphatidylserine decarboxylase